MDARALWSRQQMPADTFQQVWALSDLDSNQLLSKPEFCLFMYLMHALRNFQGSFHLPEDITPEQATRILGLEGVVGPGARGRLELCCALHADTNTVPEHSTSCAVASVIAFETSAEFVERFLRA